MAGDDGGLATPTTGGFESPASLVSSPRLLSLASRGRATPRFRVVDRAHEDPLYNNNLCKNHSHQLPKPLSIKLFRVLSINPKLPQFSQHHHGLPPLHPPNPTLSFRSSHRPNSLPKPIRRNIHPNLHLTPRQPSHNRLLPNFSPSPRHLRIRTSFWSSNHHLGNPKILQQRVRSRSCIEYRWFLPE